MAEKLGSAGYQPGPPPAGPPPPLARPTISCSWYTCRNCVCSQSCRAVMGTTGVRDRIVKRSGIHVTPQTHHET